jgi:hypothetical protein
MLEGWDHGSSPESLVSVLLYLMLGWKCWEFSFEMKAVESAVGRPGGGEKGLFIGIPNLGELFRS